MAVVPVQVIAHAPRVAVPASGRPARTSALSPSQGPSSFARSGTNPSEPASTSTPAEPRPLAPTAPATPPNRAEGTGAGGGSGPGGGAGSGEAISIDGGSFAIDEGSFTGDLISATTSRPSPARFASCYADLAAAGATAIVSIHLSAELSGTVESALTAARTAPVPVEVIDSRSIAMGLGYPVLAAAHAAAAGASQEEVAAAARRSMRDTRTLFYVDTLDYLRRSGRIGTAASLFGSALMIKPLLHLTDGHIALLEKVRTSSRAIARLEDLAVQTAGERIVDVAVQHLAASSRAEALAERLHKRIPGLRDLRVVEVGAVIGAHVGPGMLGLTVTSANH
ncbi:Hypothetical protein DUF194, DegV family [[Actinomadura] parvosata subsp. kistnae]|nr:Hypothetical protein DUF194, DegV family [Actinomadura parvosata subsp. kistnae]